MNTVKICVCGAGTMGSGIAQACAQAGFETLLYELNAAILSDAEARINSGLAMLVDKNKISEQDKIGIVNRIRLTSDLKDCIADIFIEAIIEKPDIKTDLFNKLAGQNSASAIFATNTSSLSVTEIAMSVTNPERVIGMHFFNPATIMKLVEVIRTKFTNANTFESIMKLVRDLGKTPVTCKDSPGFIVNRVARPFYIESLRLAESGKVELQQVDKLLESTGFRMGPFRLMDLIGNDINYAVSCSVYEQLGKPGRLKPSDIQKEKITQGKLGRKSGEGYFIYPDNK